MNLIRDSLHHLFNSQSAVRFLWFSIQKENQIKNYNISDWFPLLFHSIFISYRDSSKDSILRVPILKNELFTKCEMFCGWSISLNYFTIYRYIIRKTSVAKWMIPFNTFLELISCLYRVMFLVELPFTILL